MSKSLTNKVVKFLALFSGSGLLLLSLTFPLASIGAFTEQINYQGKLTNTAGSAVADGNYSIAFTLYNASSGGSSVWTETQTVAVANGLFSVMLGSVASLSSVDFNQSLYLTINVNGDGEMSPRKLISAVPNSFNTSKFDGLATTSFLRADITNATATITNLNSQYLNVSGNVGIGTTTPNSSLDIQGTGNLFNLTNSSGVSFLRSSVFTVDNLGESVVLFGQADTETLVGSNLLGVNVADALNIFELSNLGYSKLSFNSMIGSDYASSSGIRYDGQNMIFSGAENYIWEAGGFDTDQQLMFASSSNGQLSIVGPTNLELVADDLSLPISMRGMHINDGYLYASLYGQNSVDNFRIIDIRNPAKPRVVGGDNIANLPHASAKRIYASGNYAYISYDTGTSTDNFRIIDITDKSDPKVVDGFSFDSELYGGPGEPLYVQGKYVILLGSSAPGGDTSSLKIIDVSKPATPKIVGRLNGLPDGAWDVKATGDYAYACFHDTAVPFAVINVKDKSNPYLVSTSSVDSVNADCWSIEQSGPYVYLGLGQFGNLVPTTTFRVLDVSDPTNPVVLYGENEDFGEVNGGWSVQAVNYMKLFGNKLYMTTWGGFLYKFDVSSSTNPVRERSYDISDDSSGAVNPLTFDMTGNNVFIGYAPIPSTGESTRYFRVFSLPGINSEGGLFSSLFAGLLRVGNDAIFDRRVNVGDSLLVSSGGIMSEGALSITGTTTSSYFAGSLGIGTTTPSEKLVVDNGSINSFNSFDYDYYDEDDLTTTTYNYQNTFKSNYLLDNSSFGLFNAGVYGYATSTDSGMNGNVISSGLIGEGQVGVTGFGSLFGGLFAGQMVGIQGMSEAEDGYGGYFSGYTGLRAMGTGHYGARFSGNNQALLVDGRYGDYSDGILIDVSTALSNSFCSDYGYDNQTDCENAGYTWRESGSVPYAIFAENGLNYFGGKVGIGTTTLERELTVEGDLLVQSSTSSVNYQYNLSFGTNKEIPISDNLGLKGMASSYSISESNFDILDWYINASTTYNPVDVGFYSEGSIGLVSHGYMAGGVFTASSTGLMVDVGYGYSGGTFSAHGIDVVVHGNSSNQSTGLNIDMDMTSADPDDTSYGIRIEGSNVGSSTAIYIDGGYEWGVYSNGNNYFNGIDSQNIEALNLNVTSVLSALSIYIPSFVDNGAVYVNGGFLTNVNPSSRDYKSNIADTNLDIDALLGLQVKSFTWNTNNQNDFGLIAEEIQEVLPELYMDNGQVKGYRADHLPFYLLQIAQRQALQITELDNRIASGTINFASTTEVLNLPALQSLTGTWSISADGILTAKKVVAEELMVEKGVTIKDKATGEYYCIYVENGAIKTSAGECSALSTSPVTESSPTPPPAESGAPAPAPEEPEGDTPPAEEETPPASEDPVTEPAPEEPAPEAPSEPTPLPPLVEETAPPVESPTPPSPPAE